MRTRPCALVVLLVVGLLLNRMTSAQSSRWTDAHLRIATQLELMKGHLTSASADYKLGKIPLAQAHAAHPLHEEYKQLPATFQADHPEVDKALREALTRLQQDIAGEGDVAAFVKDVEMALESLDQALRTLIPADVRNTLSFQSAVLAALVGEVGEDYGQAVQAGKLINLVEYQDAFGFLQRVRVLLAQLAERLQPGDRQQMTAHLWSLQEAMPAIMPPASPTSSQAVQEQTTTLVELLKKRAGE